MATQVHTPEFSAPAGWALAPIHLPNDTSPLRVCVLVRETPDRTAGRTALLREVPGSRVYLGAVCDARARIQEWIEIAVQTPVLRDLAFSSHREYQTNHVFDQRWRDEFETALAQVPETVIVTGMETKNPEPVIIRARPAPAVGTFTPVEPAGWEVCREDPVLEQFGLPAYSTSSHRYLHQPGAGPSRIFLAASPVAPRNSHVQSVEQLSASPDILHVFNPHAGLIKVTRFSPLGLEDYLQVLEGRAWLGFGPGATKLAPQGVYAQFQRWSAGQKGIPFSLHGAGDPADRLNELFFLKLAVLLSLFQEVRAWVKAGQRPLLNLSLHSFSVRLQSVGDQLPALWSARSVLVKPGQAHALNIEANGQKYFIRLGEVERSAYLPESLGTRSLGIGSVLRRKVITAAEGASLAGTLVAEDDLQLAADDLLWLCLPVGEERVEFYAQFEPAEAVGRRDVRFRTLPARLSAEVLAALQSTAAFAKAPYEIWPLVSSPCDLYSLGVIAIRVLLANGQSQLPAIVAEFLGHARRLGEDPEAGEKLLPRLKAALEVDAQFLDLLSPHALLELDWSPAAARAQIHMSLWLETMVWLLRLFPGIGAHSHCRTIADVSPLALETVFDGPIAELENLTRRLRSVLLPTLHANQEIASVILEHLART